MTRDKLKRFKHGLYFKKLIKKKNQRKCSVIEFCIFQMSPFSKTMLINIPLGGTIHEKVLSDLVDCK